VALVQPPTPSSSARVAFAAVNSYVRGSGIRTSTLRHLKPALVQLRAAMRLHYAALYSLE